MIKSQLNQIINRFIKIIAIIRTAMIFRSAVIDIHVTCFFLQILIIVDNSKKPFNSIHMSSSETFPTLQLTTEMKTFHPSASAVELAVTLKCIGSAYNSCNLSQYPSLLLVTHTQHWHSTLTLDTHTRHWAAFYYGKLKETAACCSKRLD